MTKDEDPSSAVSERVGGLWSLCLESSKAV